jgi:hypothetical protein
MSDDAERADARPELVKFGRENHTPGLYVIDFSAVQNTRIKYNGDLCSFSEAYAKLKDSKIEQMPDRFSRREEYVTAEGTVKLDCVWTVASTMRKLIELTRQGISPYEVTWFYYDHDWSRDADESYSFFAVHRGKIIDESWHVNSEEPAILKLTEKDSEPIWHSHPCVDAAWEIYIYRKFYTDTVTGQLMVLRPDGPILYHYDRPQERDPVRDLQTVTLVKTYRLVWVVVMLLAAITFPSSKFYFAGLATILALDVMWRGWASREL